ncbi:MAG: discoidin domain-containing protein, partial [Actinobacteria bacterium]|nr:discoidin domain-containing protein [Actinomycetota bacterium]
MRGSGMGVRDARLGRGLLGRGLRGRGLRGRGRRAVAVATLTALVVWLLASSASAAELALPTLRLASLEQIASWLRDPSWGPLPQQQGGTAVGRSHAASTDSTRVGAGAGRPVGKASGQLPPWSPAGRRVRQGPSATLRTGFDPRRSARVAARSTATSSYFSNPDGSYTRKLSPTPVNYRDATGAWQPIDTTVVPGTGGRLREKANSLAVDFASSAADPRVASVGLGGGRTLSFGLAGAGAVAPVVTGSTVSYPGVLPGTDLVLVPTPVGVKQALVLHSAQAGNSWVFPLDVQGLTPVAKPDGSISLVDSAGKAAGVIPAPYAFDSKVDPKSGDPATTHAVKYRLDTSGGRTSLTVTVDQAWLSDPRRVFPVTVDPTTTSSYPTSTYVQSGGAAYIGDHSQEQTVKIGSYDAGIHAANAYLQFPYLGLDGSGVTVSAASLSLFDTWASTCTPEPFSVIPVTQPWTPSETTTYPGPTFGPAAIGSLTPTVPHACANTAADRTVGDWVSVPLTTTVFNTWATAAGAASDYGLALWGSPSDNLHWKQFDSINTWNMPYLLLTYTGSMLPVVDSQYPANGAVTHTRTPEFTSHGQIDPAKAAAGTTVKYDFQVYDASGTKTADSGLVTSGGWTVPSGKLIWGKTYYWSVQTYDGLNYSTNASWNSISVQVPQPLVTSSLSQNADGRGFDAAIGNYTTSVTDASVAAVGPSLDVQRDYNSRDHRTSGAFGAAWSSIFDAKAAERYDSAGNVTSVEVTYPDGPQVGYGRNADGSFTAPAGRQATVVLLPNGYELVDKDDTTYTFAQAQGSGSYGISSVTDASGRTVTFTWTTGQITAMTSVTSGRALHLTWATPTGAGHAHVATVASDPATATDPTTALTWQYGYSGDQLVSVCPPTSSTACTKYSYTSGSQYLTHALDEGVSSLWTFGEAAGATKAASSVIVNEGTDSATYTNVTLGQPGRPYAGTAAGFNGTSSQVELPNLHLFGHTDEALSMWFKTSTPGGVLAAASDNPVAATQTGTGNFAPLLYVGTDGKLNGLIWQDILPVPIQTATSVADGKWHHVALSGSWNAQVMWLDGVQVGTAPGAGTLGWISPQPWLFAHTYVGAGYLGGSWPDQAHPGSSTLYGTYFNGSIADAGYFARSINQTDVSVQYLSGTLPANLLTSITRRSGKTEAAVTYDPATSTVTQVTDENGGVWKLAPPAVSGSSQVYVGAVLGGAPVDYWRLADSAGTATATNEVHGIDLAYNAVTLGAPGPFTDSTAASFNGTSGYAATSGLVQPGGNQSVGLWFKTTGTAGGVLASYHADAFPAASTPGNYVPLLYVGTDGKLRGEFYVSGGASTPITTAKPVNDGNWHFAVLSAGAATQSLYLDSTLAGTKSGTIASVPSMVHSEIGAGFIGGGWPAEPHASTTSSTGYPYYFPGSISDVAFYRSPLSGDQVTAEYTAARNSRGLAPMTTVTTTDPGGRTLTAAYDPLNGNRKVAQTDGLGHRTSYGYDTSGYLLTVTDPNGNVTTMGHDARGNTVSQSTCQNQPAAACSTAYYSYQAGSTGQDLAKGAAVTASSALSTTAWYPAALTDGIAMSVTGSAGYSSTIAASAATTVWVQADMGSARVVNRVDLYPRSDGVNIGSCFPQAFTIDVSADGTTWTRVTTQTNYPRPTTAAAQTFAFTPRSVRYAKVTATTLRADSAGSYYLQFAELATMLTTADPRADAMLTSQDGRSASASDTTYLTQYGYDALGNKTAVTTPPVAGFPSGRATTIGYSDGSATYPAADTGNTPASLPVRTYSPGGATNTVSYFHNGDVASATNADGLVTKFSYDNLGRPLTKTVISDSYPAGVTTTYGYDGLGQVVTQTEPAVTNRVTGAVHTASITTTYDPDGEVTAQSVADATGGDATRSVSSTYDAHGHPATQTDADGNITTYTYDGYGNKVSETDPEGTRTEFGYDPNGNLLTQGVWYTGSPLNPQAATFLTEQSRAYDPADRLASVTDSMGNTNSYTYFDNNLLATVTRTDPAGTNAHVVESNTYDAAGNPATKVTNNGATTTALTLDAADRTIRSVDDPTGVNRITTVSYTPDDTPATVTQSDTAGATRTTGYGYDPMGNRTSQSVSMDSAGHPVGWWPLTQTSGGTVTDASGTGNTGRATGVTWGGGAGAFNGTSSQITTNGPVLNTAASYSVSAWVNLAVQGTTFEVAASQDGTQDSGFMLGYVPSTKAWGFFTPAADVANPTGPVLTGPANGAATGVWTHLSAVFNAGTGAMQLYINGQLAASGANTAPWNATGAFAIGRELYNGASAGYFNGQLANVQAYSRVLSATEVSGLYSAGRGGGTTASSQAVTTTWVRDQRGLPTAMTDPNGNVTTYSNDEAGHPAVTTAPTVNVESGGGAAVALHPVTSTGYNTFGEPVEAADPNGNVTTTVYDANGNAVSQTLPAYTPAGSATPITATTVRSYDRVGNVVSVSDPLAQATTYLYDQLGDLVRVTSPAGGTTSSVYDTNGDRLSVTGPTGAVTQATYDHLGRQLTSTVLDRYPTPTTSTTTSSYAAGPTNPGGAWLASTTTHNGTVTGYGYDRLGERTSITDGAGHTTSQSFTFLGDPALTTNPDGTSTRVDYDALQRPTTTRSYDAAQALLTQTSATYDAVGNVLSATDARGHTSTFGYDGGNHLTQEVQPVSAATSITTSFGYDAAGSRTRFTDGRGNPTITTYTPWKLPESVVQPATATYPSAADRTVTTVYDAAARAVSQTLPGGVSVSAGYDRDGNLVAQSGAGADGATASRSFGYDPAGRLTSAATAVVGTAGTPGYQPATSETFGYNDRGALLTAAGSGGSSAFGYNADGLLTSRNDAAGATSYGYDSADRLASLTDPATGTAASFSYNTLNQVSGIQYGSGGNTRSFSYDGLHRLTGDTLRDAAGTSTIASIGYGYDPNGNISSKNTAGFAGAGSNTYTYDFANRLASWNDGTTTASYGYDASGNRTQVGLVTYSYDARDQLTSDGLNTYTYTARGTVATQQSSTGTLTSTSDAYGQQLTAGPSSYTLDALGRTITATATNGPSAAYSYSGTGNTAASDGAYTYSRDPAGALVGIGTAAAGGGTVPGTGTFAYTDGHTDVVGDFTASGASLAGSTTYDPFGNVTATANQNGALGYQSGWTDKATGTVNMASRWYRPATGRFMNRDTVSVDPVPDPAAANPFAYVSDNPMTGTDPSGHCWAFCDVISWVNNNVVQPAWHYVDTYVVQPVRRAAAAVVSVAKSVYHSVASRTRALISRARDLLRQARRIAARLHAWTVRRLHAAEAAARRAYHAAVHVVRTAVAVAKKAVTTVAKFAKNHAAAIASFAAGAVVFGACTAATWGVGAVGCAALAGAAANGVTYAMSCGKTKAGCTATGALEAVGVGAATGALGGALAGPLGGKLVGSALEGVLPEVAVSGLVGAGSGAGAGSLAGAADYAGGCQGSAEGCSWSGLGRSAAGGAVQGALIGGVGGSAGRLFSRGRESAASCGANSFTASTPVLLADGSREPIGRVRVGERVLATDPWTGRTAARTVERVIVHGGRHTMVDVAFGDGSTLTATDHHPFWDAGTGVFTDAVNLHPGDRVREPSGRLLFVRMIHAHVEDVTAYNLTVEGIHTFYAGTTPVLVHNETCGRPVDYNSDALSNAAYSGCWAMQNSTSAKNVFGGTLYSYGQSTEVCVSGGSVYYVLVYN